MNILFLGLMYNREHEGDYIRNSRVGLQAAINNYQWALFDGLIECGSKISLLNCLPVGTFPLYYKKIYLKKERWDYRLTRCNSIGSINIPILKQFSRQLSIYKRLNEWVLQSNNNRTIIIYSLYLPFLVATKRVQRMYPSLHISCIVPDLPSHYGILPKNKLKAEISKLYGKEVLNNTKHISSFVLLTEHMISPLDVNNRPFVIIEGVFNNIDVENIDNIKMDKMESKKILLYTGTLMFEFGITDLMEAFGEINDAEYELWICGSGEAEKNIKFYESKDRRIHYFGHVSRDKILELQKKATVLINPRKNLGNYTKYSFPSKTIEYMASGTPVLMFKLDGIPDEYDRYLYYIDKDVDAVGFAKRIKEVCEKPTMERYHIGKMARSFIMNEKNHIIQAAKIQKMLKINKTENKNK